MKLFILLTSLVSLCFSENLPFNYPLNEYVIERENTRPLILFHGYGANYQIADSIKHLNCLDQTLISFNFPDYDLNKRDYDYTKATFGTINELLPAFYILKKQVLDKKQKAVDLYGFSAGGGAIVNLLAILNSNRYENELNQIGIGFEEKKHLIKAIEKGIVILDVPLKSIEEIIDARGNSKEFEFLANNYKKNNLRPIESVEGLNGLKLNVLLHFQENDEIIGNQDDALFIDRLKKANKNGKTTVVIGNEGSHLSFHRSLWDTYQKDQTFSNKNL